MTVWEGAIENCLMLGEYDQGDAIIVDYDELADLVEQARFFVKAFEGHLRFSTPASGSAQWKAEVRSAEERTNRPLHPCLGGTSPYKSYLPL